jgi:nucleoid DNA-binding protein
MGGSYERSYLDDIHISADPTLRAYHDALKQLGRLLTICDLRITKVLFGHTQELYGNVLPDDLEKARFLTEPLISAAEAASALSARIDRKLGDGVPLESFGDASKSWLNDTIKDRTKLKGLSEGDVLESGKACVERAFSALDQKLKDDKTVEMPDFGELQVALEKEKRLWKAFLKDLGDTWAWDIVPDRSSEDDTVYTKASGATTSVTNAQATQESGGSWSTQSSPVVLNLSRRGSQSSSFSFCSIGSGDHFAGERLEKPDQSIGRPQSDSGSSDRSLSVDDIGRLMDEMMTFQSKP